jgi:hypothetical protein
MITPHGLIHRRHQGNGHLGSTAHRSQQIIGHARRQTRHKVCRRRGHDDPLRPFRQLNVTHASLGFRV